ncbi:hypothetical protein [Streptomyces sp. NPDC052179]|uniref:hypothetical protein n=1 Tax=Streptomyces sp. NPDC052179 TaxID=3155680 RepID=UPI0034174002
MNEGMDRTPLTRERFDRSVRDVAPGLAGPQRREVRSAGHSYGCFAYGMASRSA